jgi:outer membrane protein assembly factor BamB
MPVTGLYRRAPIGLVVGAVVAVLMTGCGVVERVTGGGDPGDKVKGPHRVEATGSTPAGPVNTGAGGHHWVALSKAWIAQRVDDVPHHYGLGTDGSRVFALRAKMGDTSRDQPGEGELAAFDAASGSVLWEKKLRWVPRTDPVGGAGVVVVATGNVSMPGTDEPAEYVAFDAATGDERWRVSVARPNSSQISKDDLSTRTLGVFLGEVFYYADGSKLVGVDARTGKEAHRFVNDKFVILAGPVVAGDQLVALVEPNPKNRDYEIANVHVLAIMNKDLSYARQHDYKKGEGPQGLAAAGDLVVTWDSRDVYAIDRRNGEQVWGIETPERTEPAKPVAGVLPLLDFTTSAQAIIGIDLATGQQSWRLAPKTSGQTDRKVGVADGTLFGLGHDIEIIDPRTGKVTFVRDTNRGVSLVIAAGERIVVYSHDGIIAYK